MKFSKSILALLLAIIIAFSIVGCSSDTDLSSDTEISGGSANLTKNSEITTSPVFEAEDVIVADSSMTKGAKKTVAEKSKTIMIYIVGSDLESDGACASLDIVEMMDSGVDTKNVNVLIFTGGAKKWALSDIPANKNCIYKLTEEGFVLEKEMKRANMAESNTLTNFMDHCIQNYSADEYGLILWDHGGGPLYGYGVDEYNKKDILTMTEIQTSLKDSGFNEENKLEFVGFDACLMGSLETAAYLKDYAKYLIASQETEPGFGWDYSFLKKLNEVDGGKNIGKAIIDRYCAYYNALFKEEPSQKCDLTLSCMRLSKVSSVEKKLNALFNKVDQKLDSGYFSKVSKHVDKTRVFGAAGSTTSVFDLYDLRQLASKLSKDYKKESKALTKSIDELITYKGGNVKSAHGVSIYHPYRSVEDIDTLLIDYKNSGFASDYYEYITQFSTKLTSSVDTYAYLSTNTVRSVAEDGKNKLSIELTDEQAKNYLNSTYYILKKIKKDEYMFVFAGFDAKLKGNTLTATYDDKAIYAKNNKTGEYSDAPVPMIPLRDGSKPQKYSISAMYWYNPEDADISDFRVDVVDWVVEIDGDKVNKLGAYPVPDNDSKSVMPSKRVLNYKNYTEVEFSFSTRKVKKDENGSILPYFEWSSTGNFYGNIYSVEDDFTLEQMPLDDEGQYYFMFNIKDVNNNEHTSAIQLLS